jgi:hypothetical protein
MIKRCLLYILEHGSVPAVALALAIAPTNSRSRQQHDVIEPTERVTKMLFSEPRAGTRTEVTIDREADAEREERIFGLRLQKVTSGSFCPEASGLIRVGELNPVVRRLQSLPPEAISTRRTK